MFTNRNRTFWFYLMAIGIAVLAIPVGMIIFEVLSSPKESVSIEIDTGSVGELLLAFTYLILILSFFSLGIYLGFTKISELLNLRKEKMNIEFRHLQSQINPHFFFNVLNRLYGTIEKSPEEAKEMVMVLSEMMRYSIYDGQNEKIILHNEIEYLQKYIELNKSRYHKKTEISFETEIENTSVEITPLLFIILVENAFKHGVEQLTKDAFVHIKIKSSGKEVVFEIANNFEDKEQLEKPGIGLKNLKRRLELVYPQKHKLEIFESDSVFKATLKLIIL